MTEPFDADNRPIWDRIPKNRGKKMNISVPDDAVKGITPFWDKYKNLAWLIVLFVTVVASYTMLQANLAQTQRSLEQSNQVLTRANDRIMDIEKFISAQAEINKRLEKMDANLEDIRRQVLRVGR